MLNSIVADAPGKVVISGEYAVLEGAPALAMAVNRRATVRILVGDAPDCRLSMPGYSEKMLRFTADGDTVKWQSGQSSALFDAAWAVLHPTLPAAMDIVLDTAGFRQTRSGNKLGFGSSAALAVALTAALRSYAPTADSLASLAHRVHTRFQDGHGSGVDVATSLAGGLIEYRRPERTVRPLNWPEGLHYRLFYSGQAADTRSRLVRFANQHAGREFAALQAASAGVASDLGAADAAEFFARLQVYVQSLRAFDTASDLGIYAAGHAALADAALRRNMIYKPCGAGGGDVGIALALDPAALTSFTADAQTLGFEPLGVVLDPDGCQVREEAHA